MNKTSKIGSVGNSAGILLPKDVLGASGFALGDAVSLSVSPGKIEIVAKNDVFEQQMEIAREVMVRRREALRELAK